MSQSGDWSGLQILGGWKPQAFDSPSGAVFIFYIFFAKMSFIFGGLSKCGTNKNINDSSFEKTNELLIKILLYILKSIEYIIE